MSKKQILIILCGLPFSGKSTLAKFLTKHLGLTLIDLDEINSKLGIGIDKPVTENEWKKTYQISYEELEKSLEAGKSVIYDATNFTNKQRDKLRSIAKKYYVQTKVIWVNPPKKEVIKRWQENRLNKNRKDVSDEDFAEVLDNFENPTKEENMLTFDQTKSIEEWV